MGLGGVFKQGAAGAGPGGFFRLTGRGRVAYRPRALRRTHPPALSVAAALGPPRHEAGNCQKAGPAGLPAESRVRTRGSTMFAVIKTGGKQYRVAAEDSHYRRQARRRAGRRRYFRPGAHGLERRAATQVGAPLVAGVDRDRPRWWSIPAARRSSPSRSAAARIRAASAAIARITPSCGSPRSSPASSPRRLRQEDHQAAADEAAPASAE